MEAMKTAENVCFCTAAVELNQESKNIKSSTTNITFVMISDTVLWIPEIKEYLLSIIHLHVCHDI